MNDVLISIHSTTEQDPGGLFKCDNCCKLVEKVIKLQRKSNLENNLYICFDCMKKLIDVMLEEMGE